MDSISLTIKITILKTHPLSINSHVTYTDYYCKDKIFFDYHLPITVEENFNT